MPAMDPWTLPTTAKPSHRRRGGHVDAHFWLGLVVLLLTHVLIQSLLEHPVWQNSPYNSYTLQAWAWRHGRIALDGFSDWLELAYYQGRYYVTFPPVPALVMYPLTFVFPEAYTPDYLIVIAYAAGSYAILYRCARSFAAEPPDALFWALFAVLGSNLCAISTDGGVWFQAQGLSFLLSCAAIERALCGKSFGARIASTLLLALAVGCRPFQILFFPFVFAILWERDGEGPRPFAMRDRLIRLAATCVLPALVGIAYMAYNIARFGRPLEFGHNYLPEFLESENGQFSARYIWPNLKVFLFGLPEFEPSGKLYSIFGFSMLLANPLYVVALARGIGGIRRRRFDVVAGIGGVCVAACLFLLLNHKSFGGFQFGARYTTDALPFLLGAMWMPRRGARMAATQAERWIGWIAVAWNVYGAIAIGLQATF